MLHFATSLKSVPTAIQEDLANTALGAFRQSVPSVFDESDYALRELLFEICLAQEDFKTAAQQLAGINLDSTVKVLNEEQKADILIRCAGTCSHMGIFKSSLCTVSDVFFFLRGLSGR
jgi:hypothetical protein